MTRTAPDSVRGSRRDSVRAADVQVGDELPALEIPLTRTFIVATAIASRDYQDVHHDPGLAQERGSQDIFMNILTTNGLVGRFVTDWAGPDAVLKAVRIRLGAPNYPGDTLRLTGAVTRADGDEVEVAVKGSNRLGDHVTGTVVLALPGSPGDGRGGDGHGDGGGDGDGDGDGADRKGRKGAKRGKGKASAKSDDKKRKKKGRGK